MICIHKQIDGKAIQSYLNLSLILYSMNSNTIDQNRIRQVFFIIIILLLGDCIISATIHFYTRSVGGSYNYMYYFANEFLFD
jgi:hypothetical protein